MRPVYRCTTVLLTHDVANFNVPIHGFLEMLLKDPKLDDRQRRYVRSALVQSDNISELISDVRELSLLRSKLGDQPLREVDIIPVIKEAKEDIFSNAVYEDIETTFETQTESANIMADAFLKDLFYNLLSNACKYGGGRPVGSRYPAPSSRRNGSGRSRYSTAVKVSPTKGKAPSSRGSISSIQFKVPTDTGSVCRS